MDISNVMAIKGCIVAVVDKKLQIVGYVPKGLLYGYGAFKTVNQPLDVPENALIAGATHGFEELVVWTDAGKVYSFKYKKEGKFGGATPIDFGDAKMISVGIMEAGKYFGFDSTSTDPSTPAMVHFSPEIEAKLEIPKKRVAMFPGSGNARLPVLAFKKNHGVTGAPGPAYIYCLRSDDGTHKIVQTTIPDGMVSQMVATEERVYALANKPDQNTHGKIFYSKRESAANQATSQKSKSKLSFGLSDGHEAIVQIAASTEALLGLTEKGTVLRFDTDVQRPKAFQVYGTILSMGLSDEISFFLSKVDKENTEAAEDEEEGDKKPSAKKMKMTPVTDSTA